jgi:hypothetical protein
LPFTSVKSVSVIVPFDANVPLAPVSAGAVNVTDTPDCGTPLIVTSAISGAVNAVLITALCGVPLNGAMPSTVPPAVFVSANVADGVTPVTAAVTL